MVTSNLLNGVVHGRTIQLEQESGLPDGSQVQVSIQPAAGKGDGIRKSFGAWADGGEELDKFLEDLRQARADDRRPELD
jgi:hypothetical protein